MEKKIKIGHSYYDIVVTDVMHGNFGECHFRAGRILLDKGLKDNPAEWISTLLHEIQHAILWHMSLHERGDRIGQEEVCNAVGNGLTMIFIDNPWLLPYINGVLNPKGDK